MFNQKILDDWYSNFNLTNDEKVKLKTVFQAEVNQNDYLKINNDIQDKFFNMIKYNNIGKQDYYVSFDSCCSNIIDRLFNDYVDDDTLVLTTTSEHPSVVRNLDKLNQDNIFYISSGIFSVIKYIELSQRLKKYKKVFVYVCSVTSLTTLLIPNSHLIKLKNYLIQNNVEHVMVLDDVQGMFLYQRDYSIFDYILGTGHALIPNFNIGIVVSKNKPYAYLCNEAVNLFIDILQIIFKDKSLLYTFSSIMTEYYYNLSYYPEKFKLFNTIPFKFFIIDAKKTQFTKVGNISTKLYIIGSDIGKLTAAEKRDKETIKKHNMLFYTTGLFRVCQTVCDYDKFIENININNNIIYNYIESI